jgi:hypothetical protein
MARSDGEQASCGNWGGGGREAVGRVGSGLKGMAAVAGDLDVRGGGAAQGAPKKNTNIEWRSVGRI